MSKQQIALEQKPIPALFISMSLPIIAGLLVGGLYNIVDALFITRGIGPIAMGGVSVVFPIQMSVYALAALVGSGAASIVSRLLGAKQHNLAEKTAANAIVLALIISVIFVLTIQQFLMPILMLLGVTPALQPYALEYLLPILYATPMIIVLSIFNELVRAEGKVQFLMLSILLGSVLNIVFDPIAIFVLDWGVAGVAYATVIAQLIAFIVMLFIFVSGKTSVALKWVNFRLDFSQCKTIVLLGLPIFFANLGVSLIIAALNHALSAHGGASADYMISAYGITGRLFMFIFFPLLAMTIAYQTICGFNYGAKQYHRVREVTVYAVKITTVYCAFFSLLVVIFPAQFYGLFSNDAQLIQEGIPIARSLFAGFAFAGATGIWAMYFQAIGQTVPAIILSSIRVYLFQLPLIIVLPLLVPLAYIWYVFPVVDLAVFVITLMVIRPQLQQLANQGQPNCIN